MFRDGAQMRGWWGDTVVKWAVDGAGCVFFCKHAERERAREGRGATGGGERERANYAKVCTLVV